MSLGECVGYVTGGVCRVCHWGSVWGISLGECVGCVTGGVCRVYHWGSV